MHVENRWLRRLARPFWNGRTGRPRAPWRIVPAVALLFIVPGAAFGALVEPLALPAPVTGLAANALYALTAVSVLLVWARYVDRWPLDTYGIAVDGRWLRGAALGAAVALVAWGGALATDLALGWATVEAVRSPGTSGLGFGLAMALYALQWLLVGVWEELIFRGIVLRNAVAGLSLPGVPRRVAAGGGLVASAVLFGGLHAGQAGSTAALGFWVLAGLVLGAAYLLTGSLAIPVGLHAAFDLAVNNVFGLANVRAAGSELPMLVRPAFVGPDRFVEIAGLVNTAWVAVAGLLVLAVVRWRHGPLRVRLAVDGPDGGAGRAPAPDEGVQGRAAEGS